MARWEGWTAKDAVGWIVLLILGLVIAHACTATPAHAGEPARFDARATLQRAQVGHYSARAQPPLKVAVQARKPSRDRPQRFERLVCKPDTVRPEIFTCDFKKAP